MLRMLSPPSLKDRSKSIAFHDVVICVVQFLVAEFDVDGIEDSGLQLANWYGQNRPLVKVKSASNAQIETWVCPERTKLCRKCAGSLVEMLGKGRRWLVPCVDTKQTSPPKVGGFECSNAIQIE